MTIVGDFVTGTNVPYQRLRALMQALGQMQEGVVGAGDLKVTQRAVGGANMSVDIAPGDAWIDVDSGVRSGRAHAFSDAIENRAVAASHATLPRIDLVIFRYNDTSIPAGAGGNTPTLEVLTGNPTAGVTLDAPGASPPALPPDALLLAAILVPAASASVVAANIRDRRRWARGFRRRITRINLGVSYTTTSTTFAPIDSTNLYPRVETSGGPLEIAIQGYARISAITQLVLSSWVDGAQPAYAGGGGSPYAPFTAQSANQDFAVLGSLLAPALAAGSHLVGIAWRLGGAATATMFAGSGSGDGFTMEIRERVQQDADNT